MQRILDAVWNLTGTEVASNYLPGYHLIDLAGNQVFNSSGNSCKRDKAISTIAEQLPL